MTAARVLVIEDDALLLDVVSQWLGKDGYAVDRAGTGAQGIAAAAGVDVVVLDYRLPDMTGFDVLRRVQAEHPHLPVLMLTGHASVPHAVEAMKRGAFHYLPKPVELEEVSRLVEHAAIVARARRNTGGPPQPGADPTDVILGAAPEVESLRKLIHRLAARSTATVLITGESGTGKDLAARALHAVSARAERPFTTVTCTALPTHLLESELFGHERGAFTDAKARHLGLLERSAGGTVFLDEIGDMDLALQAKLLHVLERKRFRRVGGTEDLVADVRIVAATHVDLPGAVAQGRFRADLYYRLAVLILEMPPLRDRRGDIELLARHFVERIAVELGGGALHIPQDVIRKLAAHDWPGNVRELKNVLERAVLLADGRALSPDDIQLAGPQATGPSPFALPPNGVDVRAVERQLLVEALERTGGNITRAAKLLGMNRDQVRYRVNKFGLRDADLDLT
jgi:DNA-binding NtrC family response regulator